MITARKASAIDRVFGGGGGGVLGALGMIDALGGITVLLGVVVAGLGGVDVAVEDVEVADGWTSALICDMSCWTCAQRFWTLRMVATSRDEVAMDGGRLVVSAITDNGAISVMALAKRVAERCACRIRNNYTKEKHPAVLATARWCWF